MAGGGDDNTVRVAGYNNVKVSAIGNGNSVTVRGNNNGDPVGSGSVLGVTAEGDNNQVFVSGDRNRYVRANGDNNTITIRVTNTIPDDDDVACTAIYGYHESNVDLGQDFVSGRTYTVKVNAEMKTFTAQ